MSAKSLAELARIRDLNPHGPSAKSTIEVLVAAVPSKALAAYTTLIGVMLAANIGSTYSASTGRLAWLLVRSTVMAEEAS